MLLYLRAFAHCGSGSLGFTARYSRQLFTHYRTNRNIRPGFGLPHTAPLGQGLFEICARGREGIARSVFCIVQGQEIVILITAVKNANKLPKRQMDTARKRMKEVQSDE